MPEKILEVKNLKTHFFTKSGVVKAVDGVSFSINKGETMGLVGESACGKTITSLSVLRLVPQPAGKIVGGEIILDGVDLLKLSEKRMHDIRGDQVAMILQDPMTSLNPVFTVGKQVAWPIKHHQKGVSRNDLWGKVKEMLTKVKIPSPEVRLLEYPHQMSGGMRQRIIGAMSLSCQPKLLIADEPTTALDVTVQAQFLDLIKSIQVEDDLAMIMVTHDFGIVANVCDKVAVMYAGRIVEYAPTLELFDSPKHPYTMALMNSLPKMEEDLDTLFSIEGQPPDLREPIIGCSFRPRCDQAMEICSKEYPAVSEIKNDHTVSCWLAEQ